MNEKRSAFMKTFMTLLFFLYSLTSLASLPQVNFTFATRDIIEGQEVTVTAELSALSPNGVLVPFIVSYNRKLSLF